MLRLTLIFYSYLHLFSDFHQNLESTAKFSQPPPPRPPTPKFTNFHCRKGGRLAGKHG